MLSNEAFNQVMMNAQQMQQLQMQFNQFRQMFQVGPQAMDPRAIVQQKLNSGEMSQQQFELLRQQANALTGMSR